MEPSEDFLQRCLGYTFPGSDDFADQIRAGAVRVMDGGVKEGRVLAGAELARLRGQLKLLAVSPFPNAAVLRSETEAQCARLQARPQESLHRWLIQSDLGDRRAFWVLEWASDHTLVYTHALSNPVAKAFHLWRLEHPPGVEDLVPLWESNPVMASCSLDCLMFSLSGDPSDSSLFCSAYARLSETDRQRWCALNPPPPGWSEKLAAVVNRFEQRRAQEAQLAAHPANRLRAIAKSLWQIAALKKSAEQTPPTFPPEIYVLAADDDLACIYQKILTSTPLKPLYSVRCFSRDDSARLLAELREASPRPYLLITGTLGHLDGRYPGLVLAKACREIEPGLKVLLATGHKRGNLPWILGGSPVAIDATITFPFNPGELREAVGRLIGVPRYTQTEAEPSEAPPFRPSPLIFVFGVVAPGLSTYRRDRSITPKQAMAGHRRIDPCLPQSKTVRVFNTNELPALRQAVADAKAKGHAVVLVTGFLDGLKLGKIAILECREIDPTIKVLLWSGLGNKGIMETLAGFPESIDAEVSWGPPDPTQDSPREEQVRRLMQWRQSDSDRDLAEDKFFTALGRLIFASGWDGKTDPLA